MAGSQPSCAASDAAAVTPNAGQQPASFIRVVLYLTGDLGEEYASVLQLSAAVEAQGWKVVGVRSDVEATKTAWLRKGLLSAITIVCHGQANGIVMTEADHDQLTTDDQNWLRLRLKRFDGFLHVIPQQGEARP